MYYELWDLQSNNQIETFDTEADALVAAREYLAVNAPDFVDFLLLGYNDEATGQAGVIARGRALAERAARLRPERGHAPA